MNYYNLGKKHATTTHVFNPPINSGNRFEYENGFWDGESTLEPLIPESDQTLSARASRQNALARKLGTNNLN